MLVLSAIALVSLIGAIVPGECHSTAIVQTTSGPVQGNILGTVGTMRRYAVFKGIPYAQAPLGDLRFKPPVPVDSWEETLDASLERDICPQIIILYGLKVHHGSEDCLFLNIFTPQANLSVTPTDLKPVMFWIHGGNFSMSSGSMDMIQPDYLIEKDIVFVSINYRLGALGFLNLDHPSATGNAGLKDQNLALKWVKANIAKFGGDPNRITLIGHGSGAASVGYHILSKSSAGLFHGTISMSGSPLTSSDFQSTSSAASAVERIGKYLGVDTTDKGILLGALKTATAVKLVASGIAFAPTVERRGIATDPFITESPYRTFYTGNYNKVPQIIGFMEQETVANTKQAVSFLEVVKDALAKAKEIGLGGLDSLTTVRDALLSGKTLNQIDSRTLQTAIDITSQLLFESPIDRNQQLVVENNDGKPVYYYHMSLYTNRNLHNLAGSTILGAGHSDDLASIFYMPHARYNMRHDLKIITARVKVTKMWADFAKYGNPTPNAKNVDCCSASVTAIGQCLNNDGIATASIQWPASNLYKYALDIGEDIVAKPRPINRNLEVIQTLSWADEKKSLDIPGLLRPKLKNIISIPNKM